MPNGDNPKYVMFSLLSGFDRELGGISTHKTVSNATVFDLGGSQFSNAEGYIINELRKHVKNHGTIEELKISGHGNSEVMGSGKGKNEIHTDTFIRALESLEKELGKKITNRVVFEGCETFSELDNKQIEFYRRSAIKSQMEIVGLTSGLEEGYGFLRTGRYVQFTPKGEVIRDKLDTRYNPLALIGDDRSWIDYHLHKTQEEAEKLIRQDLISTATSYVTFKNMSITGDYEFNNDKAAVEENLLKDLQRKDAQTDKTDVLFTKDGNNAIIVSSDGMVRSRGKVKLHKMNDSENTWATEIMKDVIQNMGTEIDEIEKSIIKGDVKQMNHEGFKRNDKHFTIVVLDDNKRALLVTEDGGYEVVSTNTLTSSETQSIVPIKPRHTSKSKEK